MSEGLGVCLPNPREEKGGNCLLLPSTQLFWLDGHLRATHSNQTNPLQLPEPILAGLPHWNRLAPSQNPIKAEFPKAKCFLLI